MSSAQRRMVSNCSAARFVNRRVTCTNVLDATKHMARLTSAWPGGVEAARWIARDLARAVARARSRFCEKVISFQSVNNRHGGEGGIRTRIPIGSYDSQTSPKCKNFGEHRGFELANIRFENGKDGMCRVTPCECRVIHTEIAENWHARRDSNS